MCPSHPHEVAGSESHIGTHRRGRSKPSRAHELVLSMRFTSGHGSSAQFRFVLSGSRACRSSDSMTVPRQDAKQSTSHSRPRWAHAHLSGRGWVGGSTERIHGSIAPSIHVIDRSIEYRYTHTLAIISIE